MLKNSKQINKKNKITQSKQLNHTLSVLKKLAVIHWLKFLVLPEYEKNKLTTEVITDYILLWVI